MDTGTNETVQSTASKADDKNNTNAESNNSSTNSESTTSTEQAQSEDWNPADIHANIAKVTNVTKNKESSFNEAGVQDITNEDISKLKNKFDKYVEQRKVSSAPPAYYDYIVYPHRKDAYDFADPTKVLFRYDQSDGTAMAKLENESYDVYSAGDINRMFRLGDFFAIIPPEFINVSTKTGGVSVQPIRQSGSIKVRSGYSNKNIQVSLVLNGMNQINGYKVSSPFDFPYYVDGLRNLISQMRYTPFLPIENTVINIVHGVSNVAIRNIHVETIPGFPETLQVMLTLQEFNAVPYLRIPNDYFENAIDWDLYRWYTQLPLRDMDEKAKEDDANYAYRLPRIEGNFTNSFKIGLLTQEALNKAYEENIQKDSSGKPIGTEYEIKNNSIGNDPNFYVNVYKEENYKEYITSDSDNIYLTGLSFSMSNIVPEVQMSAHEEKTMQFLGTSDIEYQLTFETTDSYVAAKFNELNKNNNNLIRSNRFKNGIGFMKLENELVQLTGVKFVVLNEVMVNTVPNFPGLYSISISCTSYDSPRKDKEKLIGFKPFAGRDGTREDLISMSPKGYLNKTIQDATAMVKLQQIEMYPDMHLPSYGEVDYAIEKIKDFRVKNNLIENLPYDKYPRHTCTSPLTQKEIAYEGYVDPDFYVTSIFALSDVEMSTGESGVKGSFDDALKNSNSPIDLYANTKITPDKATEPQFSIGHEPVKARTNQGFLTQWENKGEENVRNSQTQSIGTAVSQGSSLEGAGVYMPSKVNKKTGIVLVDLLCDRADAGCGYSQAWRTGRIVNEKQYFDCSSFVSYGLMAIGALPQNSWYTTWTLETFGEAISESELQPGDILVRHGGSDHAALYIGNGQTVEARGSEYGCTYATAAGRGFNRFRRVPNLQQLNDAFLKAHPGFYGENSNSTSSNSTVTKMNTNGTPVGLTVNKGAGAHAGSAVSQLTSSTSSGTSTNATVKVGTLPAGEYGTAINNWDDKILAHATKYNIDPNFVKAIIYLESGGQNCKPNSCGATGLMQVIPGYWNTTTEDMLDPDKNIDKGCEIYSKWGEKYGYDINKMINCYAAGEGYVNTPSSSISLNAGNGLTVQYYVDKVIKAYSTCLANGGSSGNTNTPKVGGSAVTPANISSNSIDVNNTETEIDTTNPYGYTAEMFKNPNAGTEHGTKVNNVSIDDFGTDYMEKIGDLSGNFDYSEINKSVSEANSSDKIVEYMYKDYRQFDMKGLLVRAFPSYMLVILDEQSDWVDRKKLWTNYYVSRSAVGISVHESDDTPVAVAQVQLTNFNGNLTRLKCSKKTSDIAFDDDEKLKKFLYEATGTIFDEKISDKMIAYKNKLYDDINLEAGARVHIRLGYGSDPARYPISFNGTIAEINSDEIVTFVAQSDGAELTNQPLTDKTNSTNKDIKLGVEVSNIVSHMLVARESGFLYAMSKGFFKYKSKYGIEHFGLHVNTSENEKLDSMNTSFIKNTGTAFGMAIGAATGPLGLPIGGLVGHAVANSTAGELAGSYLSTLEDFAVSITNPISFAKFQFDIFDNGMDYHQYDILKNIYKGNYKGVPFTKSPYNPWDGEYNYRFLCQGKTVWDATKMCEKAVPDFVAYPRYYNFDTRMFYGLPSWLCKYESVIDNGELYERAKSFAQVHISTSLDSIIDNNIKLNNKQHNTNMIGLYSLGGDITTSPVVMSDKHIDWAKQKTKVIDTTSVQDFKFVPSIIDKVLSWTGMYDNGKQLAINTCVSELMTSWCRTYSGSLTLLGQPEIRANDYLYLSDTFLNMYGLIKVRGVTHSISVNEGLMTVVTPGLIANNTLKQSGMSNVTRSVVKTAKSTANILTCVHTCCSIVGYARGGATSFKVLNMFKGTANFVNGTGKKVWGMFKSLKAVTNATEYVKEVSAVKNTVNFAKGIKSAATVVKGVESVKTVATAATTLFPPALVASVAADMLLNILFTWIYDMFAYNNTINLTPLTIINLRGQAVPFCTNKTGQRTLLPGYNDSNSENTEYYEESAEDSYES